MSSDVSACAGVDTLGGIIRVSGHRIINRFWCSLNLPWAAAFAPSCTDPIWGSFLFIVQISVGLGQSWSSDSQPHVFQSLIHKRSRLFWH